jgi:hypothetical protein
LGSRKTVLCIEQLSLEETEIAGNTKLTIYEISFKVFLQKLGWESWPLSHKYDSRLYASEPQEMSFLSSGSFFLSSLLRVRVGGVKWNIIHTNAIYSKLKHYKCLISDPNLVNNNIYIRTRRNQYMERYDLQTQKYLKITLFFCLDTRSVNKVMRLPAYPTIWQYCGLALHMKVR